MCSHSQHTAETMFTSLGSLHHFSCTDVTESPSLFLGCYNKPAQQWKHSISACSSISHHDNISIWNITTNLFSTYSSLFNFLQASLLFLTHTNFTMKWPQLLFRVIIRNQTKCLFVHNKLAQDLLVLEKDQPEYDDWGWWGW